MAAEKFSDGLHTDTELGWHRIPQHKMLLSAYDCVCVTAKD